ncbi:MAG: hypothetical protein HXY40_05225 [Chloroflexi bacterium]|nr:hypothetical protein [Chloroflexota bacterium]
MSGTNRPQFMDYVQEHERTWGTETYPGRPDLAALLQSPVVVFWQADKTNDKTDMRYTVTLHTTLDDLHEYFSKLIFRSQAKLPNKRVVRIFKAQKPVIVRGIRVVFSE